MPGIEGDLRTLAAITEGIDGRAFEPTDVDVESSADAACGAVSLEATLVERDLPEDVRVSINDCTLTDAGDLQLTVDVERATDATTATPDRTAPTDGDSGDSSGRSADSSGETPTADADTDGDSLSADDGDAEGDDHTETTSDDSATTAHSGPTDAHAASDTDADDDSPDGSTADQPAYRDPERLRAVYDPESTFDEMTDALGVDVTPQTVRKYMIDHGVHDPDPQPSIDADAELPADAGTEHDAEPADDAGGRSADSGETTADPPDADDPTASDERDRGDDPRAPEGADQTESADEATEDRVTDTATDGGTPATTVPHGSGTASEAPEPTPESADAEPVLDETVAVSEFSDVEAADDLTVGDVVDATVGARTLYDVQRTLGLDADTTRQLLDDCDLIDLVVGRISRGGGPDDPAVRERLAAVVAEE